MKATFGSDRASLKDARPSGSAPLSAEFKSWSWLVASKADDTAVVHDTGNETIDGIKTFSSFPVTPSNVPTANYQVANKKYIDDKVASLKGQDGYTPIRGTDYWTAADIATMESYINSYIDTVILGGAS